MTHPPTAGYALTADNAMLGRKLAEADRIECINPDSPLDGMYTRDLREIELVGGKRVLAHVYHRPADAVTGDAVVGGDFYGTVPSTVTLALQPHENRPQIGAMRAAANVRLDKDRGNRERQRGEARLRREARLAKQSAAHA